MYLQETYFNFSSSGKRKCYTHPYVLAYTRFMREMTGLLALGSPSSTLSNSNFTRKVSCCPNVNMNWGVSPKNHAILISPNFAAGQFMKMWFELSSSTLCFNASQPGQNSWILQFLVQKKCDAMTGLLRLPSAHRSLLRQRIEMTLNCFSDYFASVETPCFFGLCENDQVIWVVMQGGEVLYQIIVCYLLNKDCLELSPVVKLLLIRNWRKWFFFSAFAFAFAPCT